jgi:predicted cobalt transporter CbtA
MVALRLGTQRRSTPMQKLLKLAQWLVVLGLVAIVAAHRIAAPATPDDFYLPPVT